MRLIDADKLIAHLEDEIDGCKIPFGSRASGKGIAYGTALGLKSAISFAKTAPTVDIKTEVARQIFAEISKRFETLLKDYPCNGDLVSAKKFLDVHWKYISNSIMSDYDTELKNKYTKEGAE